MRKSARTAINLLVFVILFSCSSCFEPPESLFNSLGFDFSLEIRTASGSNALLLWIDGTRQRDNAQNSQDSLSLLKTRSECHPMISVPVSMPCADSDGTNMKAAKGVHSGITQVANSRKVLSTITSAADHSEENATLPATIACPQIGSRPTRTLLATISKM